MVRLVVKVHRLLVFLFVNFLSVSATANSTILDTYAWTNRLVILITERKNSNLEKQAKQFFKKHTCNIVDRNLQLLHFLTDDPIISKLPKKMQSQTGVWLLGYDGSIKAFSEDVQLLNSLFKTIDEMPIRQDELESGTTCN